MAGQRRRKNLVILGAILGVFLVMVVCAIAVAEPTEAEKMGPPPRPTATVTTPTAFLAGIALIDELIECDGPGYWDRPRMVDNLRDNSAFVKTLEEFLEICEMVNAELVDRPNRRLGERLANCVWYNPAMHDMFRDGMDISGNPTELADVLEAVMDGAETPDTREGVEIALAICQN